MAPTGAPRSWRRRHRRCWASAVPCRTSTSNGTATRNADGKLTRVDFTCEPPEYWAFLGNAAPAKVLQLYRRHVDPAVTRDDLFENNRYDPLNKWNSSSGAMHLTQRSNSLGRRGQPGGRRHRGAAQGGDAAQRRRRAHRLRQVRRAAALQRPHHRRRRERAGPRRLRDDAEGPRRACTSTRSTSPASPGPTAGRCPVAGSRSPGASAGLRGAGHVRGAGGARRPTGGRSSPAT